MTDLLCSVPIPSGDAALPATLIRINRGERVAVLGESGAGKTTLLRAIRKQLIANNAADNLAWCPQETGLVTQLSVFHNIYMGRLAQRSAWRNVRNLIRPQRHVWQDVQTVAAELGLAGKLRSGVDRLSGGEQQRTAIARALYQGGELFMGDEPVSSLDPFQAEQILQLLCNRYTTLVLALHDLSFAQRYCTRIIALKAACVVLDCASSELDADQLARIYACQRVA